LARGALILVVAATSGAIAALGAAAMAAADAGPPTRSVPAHLHQAITAYLMASDKEGPARLQKALGALKGDLRLAADALRTLPPLTQARPSTQHGLEFSSSGKAWEHSIHLPSGYDGKKRHAALVLPDHVSVDPEAAIGFWKDKPGADNYVLFRPVILKHKEDPTRFPDAQFFAVDQAIAAVMRDALVHLRRHYAVDPDRIALTGLSQAGYYAWYYAASFPDQFSAVIPESAGGMAVRAAVLPLASNLAAVAVRILHARGDGICPYADAVGMRDAIQKAGGRVELITYEDSDYGGEPFPKRHPGPHHLRLQNVLPWAAEQRHAAPHRFTRVVRYRQQGFEGRFNVPPPAKAGEPITVKLSDENGVLSADRPKVGYLVAPDDVLSGREFKVGGKAVKPKADLKLLLESFKENHDAGRLAAAEVRVTP